MQKPTEPSLTSGGNMPKLREGELTCHHLKIAYDVASRGAMEELGGSPEGYHYCEPLGNHAGSKGTGLCVATCPFGGCEKRVQVIYTAPKLEVSGEDGQIVVAYDKIGSRETVKVTGHTCPEGLQKR